MLSICIKNNQIILQKQEPMPTAGEKEALLAVQVAGICGTDVALLRGYYDFSGTPGHEFVAKVVKSADPSWMGKRVTADINICCGHCTECLRDNPHHCLQRSVIGIKNKNGAFAQYLNVPLANLLSIPETVNDDQAVFIEPIAAALEILEQVEISKTDRLLVIGAGKLGQLAARVLTTTGATVLVIARHISQQQCLERAGIAWIRETELADLDAFDLVVEATGSPQGLTLARQAVRPRGTIILKSTYPPGKSIQFDFSSLVVDEIRLIGSRCGPYQKAIDWLAEGKIDPLPLIAARYSLAQAPQAFAKARESGVMKVLLDISASTNQKKHPKAPE